MMGKSVSLCLTWGIVMSDIFIMLLYVIVGVIIGILAKARKALDKYIEKKQRDWQLNRIFQKLQ